MKNTTIVRMSQRECTDSKLLSSDPKTPDDNPLHNHPGNNNKKKSSFSPSVPRQEATRVPLTDLLLHVCSLVCGGPGQDARVGEAGPQQGEDHKHKQHAANHRYERGQMLHQERATVGNRQEAFNDLTVFMDASYDSLQCQQKCTHTSSAWPNKIVINVLNNVILDRIIPMAF